MAEIFNKVGRPPVANACTHNVMVRFDDLEWDSFIGMMEKANQDVKATFIKQLVFSRPFRVLKTDRSLAVFCAKLSEFFAQFRTVGVNYDLVVKELKSGFSENKAMTMLYKLEKATLEMTSVMHEVKDLAKRFEGQWLQQLNQS
ncbi:hypothetical protein [Bacteroides caecimuris]|uniref:plasmid mobilization protein n=1 Tax=Bacteroides caecimuris TaxID=1796613 RepID=UPI0025B73A36|nr:hypothetical protein [Bacteroides caecimuris]